MMIHDVSIATSLHASVSGKALIEALNTLAPAVSKRSTLPILGNVKITSTDTGLSLQATNLETYITYDLPAFVMQHGAITTNYKELAAMLKPLGKKEVTLEVSGSTLLVKTASMVLPLSTMPAEDFPLMATMSENVQDVEMPVGVFKECIGYVAYAARQDYSDSVFNGVNIMLGHNRLTFTGADRFRLSTIQHETPWAGRWERAMLLSAQAIKEVAKKLPKTGMLTLWCDDGCISKIHCGNITISQRMIEGNYPNFEMIIPKDRDRHATVTVSSAALDDALTSLAPIAKDNANIVTCHLRGDTLHLEAIRDGMEEPVMAKVDGGSASGEIEKFLVNYAYLKEALVGTIYVTLEFSTPMRPVKITSPDVPGWTGVIMSMHPNR